MGAYERKDAYYSKAKELGFRSRAAFKLEQLQKRYRLLRHGDKVVDLGAWPGGWLQVAARVVGPRGVVVGVDREPVPPIPGAPQVQILCADVYESNLVARVHTALRGPADVVLSDLAPKLSGIRERDRAQASALVERALDLAAAWLRPGGTLVVKVFMGEELPTLRAKLRRQFRSVVTTRPEATRKGSAEMYAIARGFMPQSEPCSYVTRE